MEPAWTVPASVIPKCNGYGTISAKLVYASTVVGTSKAFKEIFIWSKSCSSSRLISHKAVATIWSTTLYSPSAALPALGNWFTKSMCREKPRVRPMPPTGGKLPKFTPIRMGILLSLAACTTWRT